MTAEETLPELFYSGMIAELYDPLVSEVATGDQYIDFIDHSGQPALEIFCGSGSPMIDLLTEGYEVHGVDSSEDMLKILKTRADAAGVKAKVFCQPIQNLKLPNQYPTIFVAGASFTLLQTDEIAQVALNNLYAHTQAGGSVLIPLEIPSLKAFQESVGVFKDKVLDDGTNIRFGCVAMEADEAARDLTITLRYERQKPDADIERVEQDWIRHWWKQDHFGTMLKQAGFHKLRCLTPEGKPARPDDAIFIFIAEKRESVVEAVKN